MKIINTCPLGSNCEKVKEGDSSKGEEDIIYRCEWYQPVKGKDPQTGNDIDDYRCVFLWMNLLTVENTRKVIELGAAIESFRNEMVRSNEGLNNQVVNLMKSVPSNKPVIDISKEVNVVNEE